MRKKFMYFITLLLLFTYYKRQILRIILGDINLSSIPLSLYPLVCVTLVMLYNYKERQNGNMIGRLTKIK